MKVFLVYWHPEPRSFNAAMFRTAIETLSTAGHEVMTSDLHAMRFDPVSSRRNFTDGQGPGLLQAAGRGGVRDRDRTGFRRTSRPRSARSKGAT